MSEAALSEGARQGPPKPLGPEYFRARLAEEAAPPAEEIAPEEEAEVLDAAPDEEGVVGQSDLAEDEGPLEEDGALADSEDGGEPEAEAEEEAREFEVVVDGETMVVSEDEARLGYMRTADYTRKTQALAEQRREIAQRAEELQHLPQLYEQLASQMLSGFDQVDWSALRPEQHQQLTQARAAREREANELRAVARGYMDRIAEVQGQKRQQEIAQARELLPAAIPGWNDHAYSSTLQYAIDELGYSREEALNTTDHRQIMAWHKAMTLDTSRRRVSTQTKAEQATEPARPRKPRPAQGDREPRPDGRLRAAEMRHAKSPSRKTHLDVIRERLALEKRQKG